MPAAAPVYRGQANALFRTDKRDQVHKRGQEVPYNVNGSPTLPPDEPGALMVDINGLPSAISTEPLLEFVAPAGGKTFTGVGNHITAGVAATGATSLRLFKNEAANGTIAFSAAGTTGTASFSDSTYAEGDLFGLYPPLGADATLDRVRVTLGTD